ncbi:MAG: YicC/YloC family endoribonuclease [Alphaproteobacteria bacterium]
MAIASMTGFARAQGEDTGQSWAWEVKSVNARGLDLRFRLPSGFDHLEIPARAAAAARFKRGSVSLNLAIARPDGPAGLAIDRAAAAALAREARALAEELGLQPPTMDGILSQRGVVVTAEAGEPGADREVADAAILAGLVSALDALGAMRRDEGARLRTVMAAQLDTLEGLRRAAEACAAAHPDAARGRLREQVEALLQASPALSEDRLAQEAALIAAKADIREEIDRLGAHIAAARELVADGAAVGRRLDFLCQELNRETNTICSKSGDLELTRIGLDLKAVVEQFREQVQNIE